MSLFKKEAQEINQTSQIKTVAAPVQQDFVNPFAQPQQPAMSNPFPQQQPTQPLSSPFGAAPAPGFTVSQPAQPTRPQFEMPQQPMSALNEEKVQEMIDETVEKIIDERWQQFTDNVQKILDWKEQVDQELTAFKDNFTQMKDQFDTLEKKIIAKVNDYDKNILDVNAEMKALEKVFQKITPTLVNNINELQKITEDLKSIKPSLK
jgi:archaellum component FlaC